MTEIVKIEETKALNVEVTGRMVLENIRANFDVSCRPEATDEVILETQYLDDLADETEQLLSILGVSNPETAEQIRNADYLILFA